MRSRRLGLRALGVCLALAGLMAVGAGSAQAETGAKWLVEGKAVTNELKAELTGSFENNKATLLGKIGGVGFHIVCTGVIYGIVLLDSAHWHGIKIFTGCLIFVLIESKAVALPACTPPGGKIQTATLKGLLSLHALAGGGTDTVTVLEPSAGTLLATFTTGEECSLGEKITLSGKLAVVDSEVGVSKVTHLITEFAPLTELYINGNKANKATLDGSEEVKLAGAHAGLKWSGDPA